MIMNLAETLRVRRRTPPQATVKSQPAECRLPGEERPVAIDADHAEAVIVLGPNAGRVEP
jgi:hypothetical protein